MDKTRAVSTQAFVTNGPERAEDLAADAVEAEPARLPLQGSLRPLGGIGPKTEARLAEHGIATLLDLLSFFPRRCRELAELPAPDEEHVGQLVRIAGVVRTARLAFLPGRRAMVTVVFDAPSGGAFECHFFNQPWLKNAYPAGQERAVEGTLQKKGKRYVMQAAKVLARSHAAHASVQLRYPELDGIAASKVQQWIAAALSRADWDAFAMPPLPAALSRFGFDSKSLFFAMHRPSDVAEHERARAHFAVREAVALFEKVAAARARRCGRMAETFAVDDAVEQRIRARLPFALTGEQDRAVRAIWSKLRGPSPMGVLLQGDVGTGKTAVAVAAALAVVARGAQVAFLAPTELLAEQHCRAVSAWLEGSDVRVHLLTGSLDARTRKVLAATMRQPGPRIWFGTHALFSDDSAFERLGLVIVDEQHRFGVGQRMQLVAKGRDPHVLVMTATPIPRTLALSLFGDLDIVSLRERPHGRPLPRAVHQPAEKWPRVVRSIECAVRRGGRVYVVCPAVGEDGEKGSAVRMHDALRAQFRCRLVHGRMAASEQQEAVAAFRRGDCDVLVGTTVLEVGVDVPEATRMVIVNADRFGLATLHQLRGRVGRGARVGLCIACGNLSERVAALTKSRDGFELAEIDLRLRGSGELLGTQQSGFSDLRALDPIEDLALLQEVRDAVSKEQS